MWSPRDGAAHFFSGAFMIMLTWFTTNNAGFRSYRTYSPTHCFETLRFWEPLNNTLNLNQRESLGLVKIHRISVNIAPLDFFSGAILIEIRWILIGSQTLTDWNLEWNKVGGKESASFVFLSQKEVLSKGRQSIKSYFCSELLQNKTTGSVAMTRKVKVYKLIPERKRNSHSKLLWTDDVLYEQYWRIDSVILVSEKKGMIDKNTVSFIAPTQWRIANL